MSAPLLEGHLLHVIPLLVPVVAIAAVLLPDVVRHGYRRLHDQVQDRSRTLLGLAGVGSATAATVHLAVAPEHFRESSLYGTFFLLAAAAQVGFLGYLLGRPSRRVLLAGLAGNGSLLVLWAVTRTVGIPVGPAQGEVERVGALDLTASLAELAASLAFLLLLRRSVATGELVGRRLRVGLQPRPHLEGSRQRFQKPVQRTEVTSTG